jgi:hypothetical protein
MPQTKTAQRGDSGKHRQKGQGRVKDPQNDGRLRENRERGVSKSKAREHQPT